MRKENEKAKMSKGGKRRKVKRRKKNKTMEELQTRIWKQRNFEKM